jgi:hypothetical protein
MADSPILKAALEYLKANLSSIPTSTDTKAPTVPWKIYQERQATEDELCKLFKKTDALGIVTGKVSGNLELIDFDNKAELFQLWAEILNRETPGLLERLILQKSKSGGRHAAYRCPGLEIPGNTKLAQRGVDVTEKVLERLRTLNVNPLDKQAVSRALPSIKFNLAGKDHIPHLIGDRFVCIITLIETRGEGGQFLADPSPGYRVIQGSFTDLPKITPEERCILIEAARSLNEWIDHQKAEGYGRRIPKEAQKPGDDFNERGDCAEILVKHGWEPVGARANYQHFRRPGKDRGQSASLIDDKFFHVFSSNAYPFESETTYSPFAVYALLECAGDYVKAAGELARSGYGDGYRPVHATEAGPEKAYLPVPPPFPLEVFPVNCLRAITEIQRAHGVPVEIPGCAFLGMAGGCIGRARGLRIKQGWVEHANLWFGIVAPSGYGKSPAVREIQRPIFALEKKWFADYQEAQRQYSLELEQRRLTPKEERATLPPPPEPPVWRQLIVDDTTTEALTDALAGNPRGIQWTRDELAGLLQDLDKYARKEGGTKARMMSAYDSGPWKVNRREASKRAFIPHATLSIFGTIQPKALPTIFSDLDAATGFLPRFIFVNSTRETPPLWTDETVSGKTRDYLTIIFERLLALDFDEEGEPVIIGVSREAKVVYENWFNEQVLEPWKNLEASVYEAVLAKLRGQCLRIALVLHCLEAVDTGGPDVSPVSLETMERAITLASFFKAHQRNAWQSIVNQDKVAELPPLPRQVARAILALEGKIVGGMLATAEITNLVNQGLDERFCVSPDTVGKTAGMLKLVTDKLPDRSGCGFRIKPEDLQRLHSFFPSKTSVPCVPSDHNPKTMGVSGKKPSDHEVSQVTGGSGDSGHLGHLPDTCKKTEEVHGSSASDTSDTSDTSFNREEENLIGGVL